MRPGDRSGGHTRWCLRHGGRPRRDGNRGLGHAALAYDAFGSEIAAGLLWSRLERHPPGLLAEKHLRPRVRVSPGDGDLPGTAVAPGGEAHHDPTGQAERAREHHEGTGKLLTCTRPRPGQEADQGICAGRVRWRVERVVELA